MLYPPRKLETRAGKQPTMPDTNEQIKEWEPMIFYVIRQLHLHPNEVDDAAQTARIALWRALQDGKTLGKTYCFIRIRGAILNERAKQAKTLQHEVASERLPEQVDQREVPLSLWLDDKRSTLPNRHFTLLCHMLHGTEASLGYSPSRLRAYKAELQRMLREDNE